MRDEDLVLIPRRVIGAACGALGRSDKKDCAALVDLRSYAFHPESTQDPSTTAQQSETLKSMLMSCHSLISAFAMLFMETGQDDQAFLCTKLTDSIDTALATPTPATGSGGEATDAVTDQFVAECGEAYFFVKGMSWDQKSMRAAIETALSTRPAESVAQGGEEGVGYGIIDPDYARIFTIARVLCWSEGYALTMHGSFTRDLDLVAVPWTDRAREPEHLARRVLEACGLKDSHSNPGEKPHGRLVWTMRLPDFGDPRFVDFSIVPPTPTPATGSGGEAE